jgi:uncharacterized protein YbjT (DUF2867 family)
MSFRAHLHEALLEVTMKFLITGATGDVGSRVVHLLLQQGNHPRIFARNEAVARTRFDCQVDIAVGDLSYQAALSAAMKGCDSLFLVNVGPQILERDLLAAQAARECGITHIVKLSSMDVQQGLAIGAWHEQGEKAIRDSGVAFTFVQPSGFMTNLIAWASSIRTDSVIRSSTGEGKRPFIHPDDIAAVAVVALTKREYAGRSLPITGPEALNFAEVAAKISAAIGKPLRYETIGDEDAGRRYAATTGASPEDVQAHVSLWKAIREGRLATVTDTVERVLGRKPVCLDSWIRENTAAFA